MSRNDYFDRVRDELFSHISRCGVLKAEPEQQAAWLEDTMDYLAERYPDLDAPTLEELRNIGMRFCSPVIQNGEASAA